MRSISDLHLFPPEAISKTPRIVLTGDQELLIEQHKGLYSYDTDRIRIRTTRGLFTVTGEKLTIVYFGTQDLLISGKVSCMQLESDVP
ncbi:MAG: YabP/YqfC family sporulation protein [Clostridia bacterium]|nr:YabP/YqfC family sporulation protein [Clostridia bacterium]